MNTFVKLVHNCLVEKGHKITEQQTMALVADKYRRDIAEFIASGENMENLYSYVYEILVDDMLILNVTEDLLNSGDLSKTRTIEECNIEFDVDTTKLNNYGVAVLFTQSISRRFQDSGNPVNALLFPVLVQEMMMRALKEISDKKLMKKWVPFYRIDADLETKEEKKERHEKEKRKREKKRITKEAEAIQRKKMKEQKEARRKQAKVLVEDIKALLRVMSKEGLRELSKRVTFDDDLREAIFEASKGAKLASTVFSEIQFMQPEWLTLLYNAARDLN